MIWPGLIFNLCVTVLLVAYLLRAVRRFERRADAIMARMDLQDAEDARKYDAARDEIRASMRAKVDAAIAELETQTNRNEAELHRLIVEHASNQRPDDAPPVGVNGHSGRPSLSDSLPN